MSDNPYASYPNERKYDEFDSEPQRMSWLAVLSMIFAVICCIPGFGLIAAILGIGALVAIRGSGGRLGGRALAIVGALLGFLATIAWLVLLIGVASGWRIYTEQIIGGTGEILEAMQDDDVGEFREHLFESASAELSDEDIRAFFAAVEHEYGDYIQAPQTLGEMLEAFGEAYGGAGVRGGNAGGGQQEPPIPVPVEFTLGKTVIHVLISPPDSFSTSKLRIVDMFVIMKNRKALTLRKDGPAADGAVSQSFDPVHWSELSAEKLSPPSPSAPEAPAPEETPDAAPAEEPAPAPES